jgi:hypothetical protein
MKYPSWYGSRTMNLEQRKSEITLIYVCGWSTAEERDNILVHLIHARVSYVSREPSHADLTATEKGAEELIQTSE